MGLCTRPGPAYCTEASIPAIDLHQPDDASEIAAWRKHPNLHGRVEQLYRSKGGGKDCVNCVNLKLEPEDIDALEADVLAETLPATTGFFEAARLGGSAVPASRQGLLVVLSAVEHADDGHRSRIFIYGIGDHGAPFVVGEPESRANVLTCHAAEGEHCQALARPYHRVYVALRNHQRRTLGDVEEQRLQLVAGLGCEDDAVRHQALAEAFLCAAASRALTAPTPTARDGSALRAS